MNTCYKVAVTLQGRRCIFDLANLMRLRVGALLEVKLDAAVDPRHS
jgi:hypothetical protein